MASLTSLRSNLNYWNGQVNQQSEKIKQLKKRRTDVENVKKALTATASSNSDNVNDRIHTSQGKLNDGIGYIEKNAQVASILTGKTERSVGSDNNLTFADSELQKELNSTDSKISEAENALATAKRNVNETRTAIAAEEQRQREEAAKTESGRSDK